MPLCDVIKKTCVPCNGADQQERSTTHIPIAMASDNAISRLAAACRQVGGQPVIMQRDSSDKIASVQLQRYYNQWHLSQWNCSQWHHNQWHYSQWHFRQWHHNPWHYSQWHYSQWH